MHNANGTVLPNLDFARLAALVAERQHELRAVGCSQPQLISCERGVDQGKLRELTLSHESALGIDDHPASVGNETARDDRPLLHSDATAGLDWIDVQGGYDGHAPRIAGVSEGQQNFSGAAGASS